MIVEMKEDFLKPLTVRRRGQRDYGAGFTSIWPIEPRSASSSV